MRYIFVIFALWCCSISCWAQTDSTENKKAKYSVRKEASNNLDRGNGKSKAKILYDKPNSDGIRHITSSERTTAVNNGESPLIVSMGAFESDIGTKYHLHWRYVCSTVEPVIKEDTPVLLKFGDDSRIELTISNVYVPLPMITVVYHSTIKTYNASFWTDISENDIVKLEKGLKKIRIEIDNAPFDVVLKKDNISQFLLEEYYLIKEQLKEKKTFYDDF